MVLLMFADSIESLPDVKCQRTVHKFLDPFPDTEANQYSYVTEIWSWKDWSVLGPIFPVKILVPRTVVVGKSGPTLKSLVPFLHNFTIL